MSSEAAEGRGGTVASESRPRSGTIRRFSGVRTARNRIPIRQVWERISEWVPGQAERRKKMMMKVISEQYYVSGAELRAPRACFMQHSDPREVGVKTFIPNVQMRKGRFEGAKTLVQGHTAKEVMGLLSQAPLMPRAQHLQRLLLLASRHKLQN